MHPTAFQSVFALPELLSNIINEGLLDLFTISSLATCSHSLHDRVMPLLIRSVRLRVSLVPSLALLLRNRPHLAQWCHAIRLLDEDQEVFKIPDYTARTRSWWEQVVEILQLLGPNSPAVADGLVDDPHHFPALRIFTWLSESEDNNPTIVCPAFVWEALAKHSSATLEELYVDLAEGTDECWDVLSRYPFPRLRRLGVAVNPTHHHWDASALQLFLNSLSALEHLALDLPTCCGPTGLDLSSAHEQLQSFEFCASEDFAGLIPSFLSRHSTLRTLCAYQSNWDPIFDALGSETLSGLRALTAPSLSCLAARGPDLAQLAHLRLNCFRMDELTAGLAELDPSTLSSLRCLEIHCSADLLPASSLTSLVCLASALPIIELGVMVHYFGAGAHVLRRQDVDNLVDALGQHAPHVVALRIALLHCETDESLWVDLEVERPVRLRPSQSLAYLGWKPEFSARPQLYELVPAPAVPESACTATDTALHTLSPIASLRPNRPPEERSWTEDSILDHVWPSDAALARNRCRALEPVGACSPPASPALARIGLGNAGVAARRASLLVEATAA